MRFTGGAGTRTFGGDFVRRQYRRARWSSTVNHDESPDGISCLDDTQTEGRFSDAVRRVGRREATESFGSRRTADRTARSRSTAGGLSGATAITGQLQPLKLVEAAREAEARDAKGSPPKVANGFGDVVPETTSHPSFGLKHSARQG